MSTVYVKTNDNQNYSLEDVVKYIEEMRSYFGEHDTTIQEHGLYTKTNLAINFLNQLSKVELPSEEEIKKESETRSASYDSICSFQDGANHILNRLNTTHNEQ